MIFINGIQRSGTNFAASLIENCEQYCWPYWKHDFKIQSVDPECDKVICVIKNPYTWVESICFRDCVDIVNWFPSHHLAKGDDVLGPFNINITRLISVYKLFYISWMNYNKTELFHYEDLLNNKNIHLKVDQGHNWDPKRAKSYLKYEAPLVPQEAKNIITETLGKEFFQRIGYPMK